MNPADASWKRVQESFERQGLMRQLGVRLLQARPGLCEVALPYSERVTQQQGGFHGGAIGALADIAMIRSSRSCSTGCSVKRRTLRRDCSRADKASASARCLSC